MSISRSLAAAVCLASALVLPPAALAGNLHVVLSADEIKIIRAFYSDPAHSRPASRGRKGDLPPGIAKNLARGKPLPPGIAKQRLPDSLERQLPRPPEGYERIVLDGRVLVVEIATQVVHDILSDLILR
jgi:hypothetical protein